MDWQEIASLVVVACTAALMVASTMRKRRRSASCCDGCPYVSRETLRNAGEGTGTKA